MRLARHPLAVSSLGHLTVILIGLALVFRPDLRPKKIEIEVFEMPKVAPPSVVQNPTATPKPKTVPKEEKRQVFGVSRKAITTESEGAAEIKQGNTVAKAQDDLKLNKDDEDSLPIPTDDYLVTAMPRIQKEFRVPYPEEAKKAGVEGPVVMDVLIDDQGRVRQVELIRGPGFGLNEAAMSALRQFEFAPARVSEKAVAVKIRYTYRFVLETR
ncbi:MAG: protein TonB [Oligoflexia bacterium]|nr:MAG: protein TonB [Oligoflexia bacterium]